jgi:hypothetical protein
MPQMMVWTSNFMEWLTLIQEFQVIHRIHGNSLTLCWSKMACGSSRNGIRRMANGSYNYIKVYSYSGIIALTLILFLDL